MYVEFSHYKDMDELGRVNVDGRLARLFAIGWLGDDRNFPKGAVPENFVFKLGELVAGSKYRTTVLRGFEPCSFCDYNGMICNSEPRMGGGVLLIPWAADYFLSPDLILHYVREHQYDPPESFIDAVISTSLDVDFDAQKLMQSAVANDTE